ncbi:hypothetical protein PAPYR_8873 [Paratrimastix pyriformis]|uniref:Uncharacterized protein n=1 Tax=Paratrimastix pyriformis TaxID=342808 RepID=A0ABQ8UEC8_9EUKA|nr:hypothetical protein PAPYR_8873 [Paratrimastix pyriformis]
MDVMDLGGFATNAIQQRVTYSDEMIVFNVSFPSSQRAAKNFFEAFLLVAVITDGLCFSRPPHSRTDVDVVLEGEAAITQAKVDRLNTLIKRTREQSASRGRKWVQLHPDCLLNVPPSAYDSPLVPATNFAIPASVVVAGIPGGKDLMPPPRIHHTPSHSDIPAAVGFVVASALSPSASAGTLPPATLVAGTPASPAAAPSQPPPSPTHMAPTPSAARPPTGGWTQKQLTACRLTLLRALWTLEGAPIRRVAIQIERRPSEKVIRTTQALPPPPAAALPLVMSARAPTPQGVQVAATSASSSSRSDQQQEQHELRNIMGKFIPKMPKMGGFMNMFKDG